MIVEKPLGSLQPGGFCIISGRFAESANIVPLQRIDIHHMGSGAHAAQNPIHLAEIFLITHVLGFLKVIRIVMRREYDR